MKYGSTSENVESVLDPRREMKYGSTSENVESAKHAMRRWFCNEIVDFLVLT